MKKIFRDINGNTINVVKHSIELLNKHPDMKVHIGTDSQNVKRRTNYVTVIAYRYGLKGVHYIYSKHQEPKIRDVFTRLFKEAEYSLDVANWFSQQLSINITIDMDYNSDDAYESNKLISSAKGWAESLGYKVLCKPDECIASRAADYHCR